VTSSPRQVAVLRINFSFWTAEWNFIPLTTLLWLYYVRDIDLTIVLQKRTVYFKSTRKRNNLPGHKKTEQSRSLIIKVSLIYSTLILTKINMFEVSVVTLSTKKAFRFYGLYKYE